ncbi:MAG: hypothetical protein FWH53_00060 [Leptospirales bacterium]|nr:hypothetical protein [Leptospirales bacterium]
MSGILGRDIAVNETGDFIIDESTGDFKAAEGMECFLSDMKFLATIPMGSLIDTPHAGAILSREVPATSFDVLKTIRGHENFLKQDPRIKSDSIKVEVSVKNNIPYFTASFKTIDEQIVENFIL